MASEPVLMICQGCGVTDRDGAPDMGIPYPRVIAREEVENQVLCDACLAAETRVIPESGPEREAIVSAWFSEMDRPPDWSGLEKPVQELYQICGMLDPGARNRALRGWLRHRLLTLEKRWRADPATSRKLALLPPSGQMELVKGELLKMQFQIGRQALDHCSVSNRLTVKTEDEGTIVEFVIRARVLQLD